MSDDLNKKIKQITDILGQENMPDNIKGLLNLLASSGTTKEEPSHKAPEIPAAREERNDRSELEENIEMIHKVKKVMDRMNSSNDPRVNLLTAIKPFMGNKRQKKLNNCIRMLQMSSIARLIDDQDKNGF